MGVTESRDLGKAMVFWISFVLGMRLELMVQVWLVDLVFWVVELGVGLAGHRWWCFPYL